MLNDREIRKTSGSKRLFVPLVCALGLLGAMVAEPVFAGPGDTPAEAMRVASVAVGPPVIDLKSNDFHAFVGMDIGGFVFESNPQSSSASIDARDRVVVSNLHISANATDFSGCEKMTKTFVRTGEGTVEYGLPGTSLSQDFFVRTPVALFPASLLRGPCEANPGNWKKRYEFNFDVGVLLDRCESDGGSWLPGAHSALSEKWFFQPVTLRYTVHCKDEVPSQIKLERTVVCPKGYWIEGTNEQRKKYLLEPTDQVEISRVDNLTCVSDGT